MRRLLIPSLLLATAVVAAPSTSPIAASLEAAAVAAARSDWTGALAALSAAERIVRPKAPLVISAAEVVTGAHVGVGVYDKAVDGVVDDKRLRLYVEVENPTASPLAPGRWRHEVDVVGRFFVVEGANLDPLGEKNLGRQTVDTWRPLDVHALGLDVTLGDAPAGPYLVEIVVTDVVSKRSTSRRVPFTLRERGGRR